ncbi:MAG: phage regulatory CII family protein [Limisphaerales bacterium]
MQSYELLREVFDKRKPKEIADDLGLSASMIYKWAEPNSAGSGIGNPLDRIEALLKSTGDNRLVQWICQRAGGFFILNPKNTPHPHALIPATNQIVQEFADLLHVIATATANETLTLEETRQIRARWEELKSVTEGFVKGCEEGDFAAIRERHSKHQLANAQQARV